MSEIDPAVLAAIVSVNAMHPNDTLTPAQRTRLIYEELRRIDLERAQEVDRLALSDSWFSKKRHVG